MYIDGLLIFLVSPVNFQKSAVYALQSGRFYVTIFLINDFNIRYRDAAKSDRNTNAKAEHECLHVVLQNTVLICPRIFGADFFNVLLL